MKRIDCINKIVTYAARFVLEVEGFNATNQYHINIHAESFLIPVLNEVFGLSLENLNNTQRKNFPAIDLADFKNRVAFQITSTANLKKIKDTLELFFEYKLEEHFDILYMYVITEKQGKYSEESIQNILPEGFNFQPTEHVLDKDSLLQRISAISSTPKLEVLAKLYEHEFSDVQIENRKQKFEFGYLNAEPENLFPNLLELSIPTTFYKADLNLDEQEITKRVNAYLKSVGKRGVKKIKKEKLVRNQLRENQSLCSDWILFENSLLTFRNLHDHSEPLRSIVDIGTITPIECEDFAFTSESKTRVFKNLLRNTLIELCWTKGIEWFGKRHLFRFANNRKAPNNKRIKWKGKKESTKTVIFQMINKKEKHVICYRNLAFKASFEAFDDKWFLVVNPTWSFTDPYGYRESRFESSYMSGLKRLENNGAVYNYFRFFGYYLSYVDLFTIEYPYMKVMPASSVLFSPRLEEKKWRPAKVEEVKTDTEGLDIDNELDNTLFD